MWWLVPFGLAALWLSLSQTKEQTQVCQQCGEQADFGPLCIAHLAELFPSIEDQFIAGKFLCFKHVFRKPHLRADGWYGHIGAFYRLPHPTFCTGAANFFLSPIGGFVESKIQASSKPEDQAILACLIAEDSWRFDSRYIITASNPEVIPVLAISVADWIDQVPLKEDSTGQWQPDYENPGFVETERQLITQAIRAANRYLTEIWPYLREYEHAIS